MSVVCGADFSEASGHALSAAAHLAARSQMPLHVVHGIESAPDPRFGEAWQESRDAISARFLGLTEGLRELVGSIELHLEEGLPDEALLAVAARVSARLIVVGPAGRRLSRTTFGGHADRIAQRSRVPVLVVRDATPFERWTRDGKALRIVCGSDPSSSSEAALRWIGDLRAFGPCEVVAIHLYWPPDQFRRLGLEGVRSYMDPDPLVAETLEREFAQRLERVPGATTTRYRSEPHLGRVGDRLAELALEEQADLVVVGSRDYGPVERLREGSVSRDLLRSAAVSVACIPALAESPKSAFPDVRSVLVATDFSPTGDAAIPLAYAMAGPGGTVHLVHVAHRSSASIAPHDIFIAAPKRGSAEADGELARLCARIPSDAGARGRTTQVHVLDSKEPARAIDQAAERLGVDLICLGTHGRSVAARAVLGSVAQKILSESRRPVLLARAPV